jgi:hypothetical protein
MNQLAAKLGLSTELEFYDVYSLDESELSHIPRPALALLVIIPLTPSWEKDRQAEDVNKGDYQGSGPQEPVIWFKQTIGRSPLVMIYGRLATQLGDLEWLIIVIQAMLVDPSDFFTAPSTDPQLVISDQVRILIIYAVVPSHSK